MYFELLRPNLNNIVASQHAFGTKTQTYQIGCTSYRSNMRSAIWDPPFQLPTDQVSHSTGGGLGTPSDEVVVGPRRVAVTCRATGRLSSSDPADDLAEISSQHSRVPLPDTLE